MSDSESREPGLDERRVALVVGASGLVGSELVRQLLGDEDYDEVRVFVRRPTFVPHPRLRECVVDFRRPESFAALLEGEVLFSCLGTTLKAAGSKEAQYEVDFTFQYEFAERASERGVPGYVLVSAMGADARSWFFYSRIKGELELAVRGLPFTSVRFLRPSILDGERRHARVGTTRQAGEERKGEEFGLALFRALPRVSLFDGVRPTPIPVLARAMRHVATDWSPGVQVIEAARILLLGAD